MELAVVFHRCTNDLTVNDLWSLDLNRFFRISGKDFNINFNVDEKSSVDVFRLQKSRLKRKNIEVSKSLQMVSIVLCRCREDRVNSTQ